MTAERQCLLAPSEPESGLDSIASILAVGLLRLSVQNSPNSGEQAEESGLFPPDRLALSSDSRLSVDPTGKRPVRGHTKEVTSP